MDNRVKIIGRKTSCLNNIMCELRSVHSQADRLRFRTNLEKIGEILAYEISRDLEFELKSVETPFGEVELNAMCNQPVVVSLLRAGLPFHNGFLRMLDHADNGFISAYRHHTRGNDFIVRIEYVAIPEIDNRDIILVDPMIATGKSIVLSYERLLESGTPGNIYIAGVIGSEEGIEHVLRNIPEAKIYMAAVDSELTARGYIVPGLGDAGDLAYGPKGDAIV